MRCLKLWTCVVHLILLLFVPVRVTAAPALTTIQDTLFKADGARFNGVAYIEWNTFQAADQSVIAASSVVLQINDGAVFVRLVPTSNASAGARYTVRYHAEGKLQFTETWNVVPSPSPVGLSAVRVPNGAFTGVSPAPAGSIAIEDVAGLSDALDARPVRVFANATPERIVKTDPFGRLTLVAGDPADCIRVDGTTGPCGSASGSSGPGFVDQEVPAGAVNGSNTVFTLAQTPTPASSLQLYRNGILMKTGVDYSLSNATINFGGLSVPQAGDLLLAAYRLADSGAPAGLAMGALSGSYPAPQIAESAISNFNIATAAGIAESKLALNFPTHSNAYDPSAGEKAALSGTSGAPSGSNKYVTNGDSRLSNARPPQSHPLLGAEHGDTNAGTVQRGDLIVGSAGALSVKWTRLPIGAANRCLMSNGSDAIWNTCLYTGFTAGAVPFTGAQGTLEQAPLRFTWDDSNRRLSVGSNANLSTLSVHDGAAGGITTITVRGGAAQGQAPLQVWQTITGVQQAGLDASGVFSAKSIEASSSAARPAWREAGTAVDPSGPADGDAWHSTANNARKSFDSGQIHSTPQVICASTGSDTVSTTLVALGTCSFPPGLLKQGDQLAIRATWSHSGTGSYNVRWRWGGATVGLTALPGNAGILVQKGDVALYSGGAVIDGGAIIDGATAPPFLINTTESYGSGLTFTLEGSTVDSAESLRLLQFSVVRFPAQNNP